MTPERRREDRMVTRPQDLDCMSNSCQFGGRGKGGMRTNGRCTCVEKLIAQVNDYENLLAQAAQSAYAYADAMLKVRAEVNGEDKS